MKRTASILFYSLVYMVAANSCSIAGVDRNLDTDNTNIGATDIGMKKKLPGFIFHRPKMKTPTKQYQYATDLLNNGEQSKARRAFLALVHEWHDSHEAAQAQLQYASILKKDHKYIKAFNEYQYLIKYYPGRFSYEKVVNSEFRIAYQVMTMQRRSLIFLPSSSSPERALPLWEDLVANAPRWNLAADAQYYIGQIHESQKDWDEAILAYDAVISHYPDSALADEASFKSALTATKIALQNRPDEKKCRSAMSKLSSCIAKYPNNSYIPEAKKSLKRLKDVLMNIYYKKALFYDINGDHPKAALFAYSDFVNNFKYASSDMLDHAKERIEKLVAIISQEDVLEEQRAGNIDEK